MNATIQSILDRVKEPKKTADGWESLCPVHENDGQAHKPSLRITQGEDGRALVKCRANCETADVVRALGLQLSDLFPESERKTPRSSGSQARSKIVAEYAYRDEQGMLLYQTCRFEPKDFRQRAPKEGGGWEWKLNGARRVLYRLSELVKANLDAVVLVVEGEKDVENLTALGFVATCNVGGAGKWREDYNQFLRGRHVVLIGDNDDPGRKHVQQVAKALHGVAASIRILELPGLPEKGDVSDWIAAGGTADELHNLIDATTVHANAAITLAAQKEELFTEPPVPFGRTDVPMFPVEALAPWHGQWVAAEAEATQTPVDLAAMISISAIEVAVAGRVEVLARPGWAEPVNGFNVVALPPGNRKSAVFRDAMKPVEDFERLEADRMRPVVAEAQTRWKILEKRQQQAMDRASKATPEDYGNCEREARDLTREIAETTVPVVPQLLVDDCSQERLATILRDQGGRLGLCSPEGDAFDIAAGRYAKAGANIGIYLKAHCGDQLRVDRVNRPPEFIDRPTLTIGLAVQPDVIAGLANQPTFRGRGLLARFCFAVPVSNVGSRKVNTQPVPLAISQAYHAAIRRLLQIESDRDEDGKPQPHLLRLSPEAQAELVAFEQWVEPQLSELGELGAIADWGAKLVGTVVRLAGIVHMSRHAQLAAPWREQISAETLRAAISIGEYLIPHARAAFAIMGADALVEDAKRVLAWIERGTVERFTKRDAYQALKGRFKRVDDLDPLLTILERHNHIREVDEPHAGPGRKPSPVFSVNPFVRPHNSHNPHNFLPSPNSEDSGDSGDGEEQSEWRL